MTKDQLKIKRLEMEQMLVLNCADDLNKCVEILIKHADMETLEQSDKMFLVKVQLKFLKAMESLIEGA